MGNNRDGKAKFEFVGTNNNGELPLIILKVARSFGKL
ncbi:hypothetical protein ACVIJU_001593 [Aeribacillus sp. SP014]